MRKGRKAARKVHQKNSVSSTTDFTRFVNTISSPDNEVALLSAISIALNSQELPVHLRIETRKTRISFFDNRISNRSQRVARIELGKQQPDILVLTEISETHPELTKIATPSIHDKGEHMRRFRLGDEQQARKFGQKMMSILME